MGHTKLSVYLSFLLRHHPETLELHMDKHGYVDVDALITAINKRSRYSITKQVLDVIVKTDPKGRYAYSSDGQKIRACQGHSIPGMEPILAWRQPPDVLYHGTTETAYRAILDAGEISKMQRHAVHLQTEEAGAWQSARRWKRSPVVLEINAAQMAMDGYAFGLSDNGIWCVDHVPVRYIVKAYSAPSC
ncbi:MAG: RNA 2'-phosphotransferase [Butyricicoccaceae bacterium]